ncbi:MAG: MFS transporter [Spirochaetales bacterium]|nr:MFS transporter [Spirochaetales bacterium]
MEAERILQQDTLWKRNIRLITLIRVCFSFMFAIPVITLYWQNHGLTIFDIFLLQAIFSFSVVIFEIPTGYIGDLLGRKKTIIFAAGIKIIGWIVYANAPFFWGFVAAEIILGLSMAFLSGTDSSLVYESLKPLQRETDYTKIEGRIRSIYFIGAAVSSVIGGILAEAVSIWVLLLGSALIMCISFIASFFITEPERNVYSHPKGTLYGFYKIFRYVFLRSKIVRAAVPLFAVCSLATMLGIWLYQPLWTEREVPLWLFGILWALLFVPSSFGSQLSHHVEKLVGKKLVIWLFPVFPVAGYILAGFLPGYWAVFPIYLVNILFGIAPPIITRYIHEETYSDKRATVLSIASFLFRISYTVIGPIVGFIALHGGLSLAFFAIAGTVLSLMLMVVPFFQSKLNAWEQGRSEN